MCCKRLIGGCEQMLELFRVVDAAMKDPIILFTLTVHKRHPLPCILNDALPCLVVEFGYWTVSKCFLIV